MAVQVPGHHLLGPLDKGRHALHVASVQHGVPEVSERQRGTRPFAYLFVEGDGLFEGHYGPLVVLLEGEDEAQPVERPGPYGGETHRAPPPGPLPPPPSPPPTPPPPQ